MAGTILASVPVNVEGGAYLTFWFPLGLFCVIATILYVLLFGRPHARVPARRIAAAAHAGPPAPGAAQAAAVASGLPTAEGGGSVESGAEPGGAARESAAASGTGNVPDQGDARRDAPTEGTEASE